MSRVVRIAETPEQLAKIAARRIAALAREALADRGVFRLALAGGRTPRPIYRLLAGDESDYTLDWSRVEVFFSDERDVPPDDPQSNFRMARESLLDHVPVHTQRVHPMRTECASLRRDAARYGAELRRQATATGDGWPQMDLTLLGLGADGHTASLFPATCVLHERQLSVAAVYVPQLGRWRLTLTIPTLEHSRHLLFLVSGADKSGALAQTLLPASDKPLLPVQQLQPRGAVEWYCDRAAAAALPPSVTSA